MHDSQRIALDDGQHSREGQVAPLPQQTVDMLAEMDGALADEINAKQKSSQGYRYTARHGRLISEAGAHYRYAFSLDEPWEPDDDTPLRIQVGATPIHATVVSATGTMLDIATETQLPLEALEQITLVNDPTQLLERLREALKSTVEGGSQLGSKAFCHLPFASGQRQSLERFPDFIPNPSQANAIRLSLGSEVAYIIGPPGTGKTSMLAAVAYTLAYEGRSVLITAHTNIAVDNAILKLAELAEKGHLPALPAGRVIRYGTPQLKGVSHRDDIYPSRIAGRLGAELEQQRAVLTEARTRAQEQREKAISRDELQATQWAEQRRLLIAKREEHNRELTTLLSNERQRVSVIDGELHRVAQARTQAERRHASARQELTRLVARQSQIENTLAQHLEYADNQAARLTTAQRMGDFERFIRRINVDQLARQVADAKQASWEDGRARDETRQAVDAAHKALSTAQREQERVQAEYTELMTRRQTPPETANRRAFLHTKIASYDQRLAEGDRQRSIERTALRAEQVSAQTTSDQLGHQIADIEEKLRDLERRLLDEAQVVATTLSKLYMNAGLRERRFDCVIMDEVSMASLPAVYLAASRAQAHVIAFGDPRQLAPIATAKTERVMRWLKRDLFAVAGVSLEQTATGSDGRSALLNEQARMHPSISVIARKHVYGGLVKDAERSHNDAYASAYASVSPVPGKPLVLCDTSDGAPVASKPGTGAINLYHALCALAAARQILASLPSRKSEPGTSQRIGIATPYAKQARLIQRMVKAGGLEHLVRVGTIHRFQGLEFEAVIFDTVESAPIRPFRDFIGGGKGSEGQHLINVAVTRPQHKLILIANAAYIATQFEGADTMRLAVDEAKQAGVMMSRNLLGQLADTPHSQRLGAPSTATQGSSSADALLNFELLTEKTFYDRFFADVRSAKSSVTVFSPFVKDWRTRNVVTELQKQRSSGVRVTVIARDTNRDVDRRAKLELEQAGVVFRVLPDMHEKIVLIDDNIVYLGSLNALSHRTTSELMVRFVSQPIAQQIAQFVRSSGQKRDIKRHG